MRQVRSLTDHGTDSLKERIAVSDMSVVEPNEKDHRRFRGPFLDVTVRHALYSAIRQPSNPKAVDLAPTGVDGVVNELDDEVQVV
jgi:hypothetical protein